MDRGLPAINYRYTDELFVQWLIQPKVSFEFFLISSGIFFSESKGPPGASLVIKNVSVAITKSVGIACKILTKMNFTINYFRLLIPNVHICMDGDQVELGTIL